MDDFQFVNGIWNYTGGGTVGDAKAGAKAMRLTRFGYRGYVFYLRRGEWRHD